MSLATEYCIPDLLDNWPWRRCLSPYYEEAKQQSSSWVRSLAPFRSEKGQRAFDACDLSQFYTFGTRVTRLTCFTDLLASLAYSHRDKGNVLLSI